jgi:heme exporter protein A
MWRIVGENITQQFNRRTIFRNISFEIKSGESLVLIGPNGSGKTTLIRIICHLLRPTAGKVTYLNEGKRISFEELQPHLGLVGPYLQLYNNLTAFENYTFFSKIRGLPVDVERFRDLMKRLGLAGREMDELRTYSSGMLQRMKYVCALIHDPDVLILDEPTSNLDEEGVQIVYRIIEEQKRDKILILATNEPGEFRFGDKQIHIAA